MNMSDTPRNRYGLLDHLEWTEERHAAQIRKFAPFGEDIDLAIENMGRYIDRLEAKLEIADEHGYNGIDCRDETIKLLDANLKERNQQLSTERARADKAEKMVMVANCPNCDGSGGYGEPYIDRHGQEQIEHVQCEWCFDRAFIDKAMKDA